MSVWAGLLATGPLWATLVAADQPHHGGVGPPECARVALESTNSWQRLRAPGLLRYCSLLSRANTNLALVRPQVRVALSMLDEAERLLPGRAATSVLRARAELEGQSFESALVEAKRAGTRDPRTLEDPQLLHVQAVASLALGRRSEARAAMQKLQSRLGSLPTLSRVEAQLIAGAFLLEDGQWLSARRSFDAAAIDAYGSNYHVAMAFSQLSSERLAPAPRERPPYPLGDQARQLFLAERPPTALLDRLLGHEWLAGSALVLSDARPDVARARFAAYAERVKGASREFAQRKIAALRGKGSVGARP